jgi:hypothetical protein
VVGSYPAASNSAMPTWPSQATPAYLPTWPTGWPQAAPQIAPQAVPVAAPQAAPVAHPATGSDSYLSGVSNESLEVLNHFGEEAPALLNRYACTVEDALLQQARQSTEALQQVQRLSQGLQKMEVAFRASMEDNRAYNLLVTTPELLANYVNDFFGPNGPAPVELPQDRLAADVAAAERQSAQNQQLRQSYQRPQMDMPAPGARAASQAGSGEFWSTFQQVSRERPDQVWRLLSQVPPEALRAKSLISEAPPF